jgi:uncharacterized membrane protein
MNAGEGGADDRRGLAAAAFLASLVWLIAVALAPRVAARHEAAPAWQRASAALVYLGASVICHQRPERSYHVDGVPLPLCARCTGLHAGAALGLLALATAPGAWRRRLGPRLRLVVCLAVLPTVISIGVEWLGGPSALIARTLTALPAGAMAGALVGLVIAGATRGVPAPRPQRSATLP